jgi:hypothetical protein
MLYVLSGDLTGFCGEQRSGTPRFDGRVATSGTPIASQT